MRQPVLGALSLAVGNTYFLAEGTAESTKAMPACTANCQATNIGHSHSQVMSSVWIPDRIVRNISHASCYMLNWILLLCMLMTTAHRWLRNLLRVVEGMKLRHDLTSALLRLGTEPQNKNTTCQDRDVHKVTGRIDGLLISTDECVDLAPCCRHASSMRYPTRIRIQNPKSWPGRGV